MDVLESREPPRRLLSLSLLLASILSLLGGIGGFVVYAAHSSFGVPRGGEAQTVPLPLPDRFLNQPGIERPATHPADDAGIPEDTEIFGVVAGGRARAYVLNAFVSLPGRPLASHVVNDVLGGVPLTITYCDRLNCVRVFTNSRAKGPLPVALGGWTNRDGRAGMLLCIDAVHYRQEDGEAMEADAPPFPYTSFPYGRTTWKEWRAMYPDTDVYFWQFLRSSTHPR